MKYLLIIVSCFILFSCSNSSETLDQTTTESGSIQKKEVETQKSPNSNLKLGGTKAFLNYMEDDFSIEKSSTSFLKDIADQVSSVDSYSFKAKTSHRSKKTQNKDRFQEIELTTLTFETEAACTTARQQLLECFPPNCLDILNNKYKAIRTVPGIYIFNPTSITVLRTSCQDVNDRWLTILHNTSIQYSEEKADILIAECGRTLWLDKTTLEEGFRPYVIE